MQRGHAVNKLRTTRPIVVQGAVATVSLRRSMEQNSAYELQDIVSAVERSILRPCRLAQRRQCRAGPDHRFFSAVMDCLADIAEAAAPFLAPPLAPCVAHLRLIHNRVRTNSRMVSNLRVCLARPLRSWRAAQPQSGRSGRIILSAADPAISTRDLLSPFAGSHLGRIAIGG
jgi:hypothetical protein